MNDDNLPVVETDGDLAIHGVHNSDLNGVEQGGYGAGQLNVIHYQVARYGLRDSIISRRREVHK